MQRNFRPLQHATRSAENESGDTPEKERERERASEGESERPKVSRGDFTKNIDVRFRLRSTGTCLVSARSRTLASCPVVKEQGVREPGAGRTGTSALATCTLKCSSTCGKCRGSRTPCSPPPGRPPPLQSPGAASGTRWPSHSPPATDTLPRGSRTPSPPPPGRPLPLQSPGTARGTRCPSQSPPSKNTHSRGSCTPCSPPPGRPTPLQLLGPECVT
jgi:hypothetical protein